MSDPTPRATSRAALVALAQDYVSHLLPRNNVFSDEKPYLRKAPWEARTRCSSFLTLILGQLFKVSPTDWVAMFGRKSPFARDYFRAVMDGKLERRVKIGDVQAGDLGFIGYDEDRNGFTGHSFIVVGKPELLPERWGTLSLYAVKIVDSSRSSHGPGDTRFGLRMSGPAVEHGGIGMGSMRFAVAEDGSIVGYMWSLRENSELLMNTKGQTLVVAAIPSAWRLHESV